MPMKQPRPTPGRPEATTRAAIERSAFQLFARHGFEGTTVDMIAAEVGIGRRTLFRYYDSKNDIPWGEFRSSLIDLRRILASTSPDLPVWEAVHLAVLAFNRFDDAALPLHRQRMRLILETPALEAHSVHQYAAWRGVIADYVAFRLDLTPHDLLPRTVGHVSLALSIAAYEQWLSPDTQPLQDLLDQAMTGLRAHLAKAPGTGSI